MESFVSLILPIFLLVLLIRLMTMPIRLGWKILINSGGGFVCLWLLNAISGFTGIRFPINAVTAATAGFLGIPGIVALALLQMIL